jgi:hypothetical protein
MAGIMSDHEALIQRVDTMFRGLMAEIGQKERRKRAMIKFTPKVPVKRPSKPLPAKKPSKGKKK